MVDIRVQAAQPLLLLPSQLPKPALQVGLQAPAVQAVPPLALVHAPQVPQFDVVVAPRSRST